MTNQPISNEVALRIALAARALPDISVKDLIEALQTYFEEEITPESLSKITVTQLKGAFGNIYEVDSEWEGEDADNSRIEAFKEAVRILWGETTHCQESLPIELYREGDMPEWHEVKHSGEGCKGAGSRGRGRMYTQISPYPAGAKCFFLPTLPVLSASFSLLVKLPAPLLPPPKKLLSS
jgi:hypothetical protein